MYLSLKGGIADLSLFVFRSFIPVQANFKESYMAAFYDYFNEQKYADAVKNVSVPCFSLSHVLDLGPVQMQTSSAEQVEKCVFD